MPETRSVPRNVRILTTEWKHIDFENVHVSYEGGFVVLRKAADLGHATAIPGQHVQSVTEVPVNTPLDAPAEGA